MDNEITFCQICDLPIPEPMTNDGICNDCWEQHAADLAADGDAKAAAWAKDGAASARGQLLLKAESCEHDFDTVTNKCARCEMPAPVEA